MGEESEKRPSFTLVKNPRNLLADLETMLAAPHLWVRAKPIQFQEEGTVKKKAISIFDVHIFACSYYSPALKLKRERTVWWNN